MEIMGRYCSTNADWRGLENYMCHTARKIEISETTDLRSLVNLDKSPVGEINACQDISQTL